MVVLSVTGNSKAPQGAKNICRLLELNNRSVPVYIGQPGPIMKPLTETKKEYFHLMKRRLSSFAFHGHDGFGDE